MFYFCVQIFSYPLIIKNSTVLQTLLGYGEGCSGYPFTQLYGQALSYSSWSVESDFINILISRGVFGFVAFYSFLTSAIWKGIKVNKKYGIVLSIFLLQGITYNIQTDGVFFIEVLLYCFIVREKDIFDIDKKYK